MESHGINVWYIIHESLIFMGILLVNIPFVPLVLWDGFPTGPLQGCTSAITVTHVAMALKLGRGRRREAGCSMNSSIFGIAYLFTKSIQLMSD